MDDVRFPLQYYRYLIIGGTTKAGTTSLFNWLAEHPEVSASFRKETNFFLDKEWGNPSIYRYEDGIEKYGANYSYSLAEKLYIEASPDYLYSSGTPLKIFKSLPKAKILFILRNPFSRLISWYKFAKQIGVISQNLTFDNFIIQQSQNTGSIKSNILEQGLYSKYLIRYFEIFDINRIKVIFFEELADNPLEVINQIYITIRKNLSLKMPLMYIRLKKIWDCFKPLYIKLNTIKSNKLIISKHSRQKIIDSYSHEINKLESLLKRKVPWRMEKWLNQ
jgi:hypothetical protein